MKTCFMVFYDSSGYEIDKLLRENATGKKFKERTEKGITRFLNNSTLWEPRGWLMHKELISSKPHRGDCNDTHATNEGILLLDDSLIVLFSEHRSNWMTYSALKFESRSSISHILVSLNELPSSWHVPDLVLSNSE